ncbi:MAG: DUF6356 family protein [Dongiaceae bacterium]
MRLGDAFCAHPASVGESYGQHLQAAAGFGAKLWLAGLLCMIHAFLPFLFVRSASAMVKGLHDRMILHRRHNPAAATPQVPDGETVLTVR